MSLTEEQLSERRKGITATDIGKIAGQNPFGCALDVQMAKQGIGLPFVEHDRVRWGNILEDPIRQDYAERHGVIVVGGDEIGTLRHPTEPWALATPDTMVYSRDSWNEGRPLRGHEIKTHISWLAHHYGEPGTDQIPPHELIQCVWNTWVARAFYGVPLERWDLTVFLDGLPTDYTIMRDPELETALVELGRQFWVDHIVEGQDIPPDGSEHYSKILSARWPKNDPDMIIEATPEALKLIRTLREARTDRKAFEDYEERMVQEVKLIIGDASTLQWKEVVKGREKLQKVNWKRSKDSERVDWKVLAAKYRELVESAAEAARPEGKGAMVTYMDALVAKHTATKAGSRSFTVPRNWSTK